MTKKIYIVLFALGLSACASQAPLDDAYYWPEKRQKQEQKAQEQDPIEYLNIQDTTVTIRINR